MSASEHVVVVAPVKVKPGREDTVRALFEKVIRATHDNDEGCLLFALHRDLDDPHMFVFVEHWTSAAALEAHAAAPHSAELAAALGEHIDGYMVLKTTALPVGDADKGAL
jgi:quinol monooxygenase YgiN